MHIFKRCDNARIQEQRTRAESVRRFSRPHRSILCPPFIPSQTKYDRVVGGLVHRGAFQSTVEGALYSIITEGHAKLRVAESMARQLLSHMELGPEGYDNTISNEESEHENQIAASAGAHTNTDSSAAIPEGARNNASIVDVDLARATWASPRQDIQVLRGSGIADPPARVDQAEEVVNCKGCRTSVRGLSLGACLGCVRTTHQATCTRYANRVAELTERNACLVAEAAEAANLRDNAGKRARERETRYRALEERCAEVERQSQSELALTRERAEDEQRRSLEAAGVLQRVREKAKPSLIRMVKAFTPVETEALGVELFEKLGVDPDQYAHILARKHMLRVRYYTGLSPYDIY